ncbi:DUF4382 domain-containing protein [Halomarina rubra]|uniref:DUF4382 domain-containing protein n=1 Tax=Halomarina rubra TaxID=2071873 RepID=A0ABD6AVC3_9EURY|nr:DUF4382 domain-containing protein [Halomarina rubra]
MKRTASALLVLSMVVLAGCSASLPGSSEEQTGTVQLYVSDERNAIEQFSSLNVTVTGVAFQTSESVTADASSANASADGSADVVAGANTTTVAPTTRASTDDDGTWETHSVDNVTVDLTRLKGENATRLGNLSVAAGEYDAVRLEVGAVDGRLTNGERVTVKLPSDRLRLNDGFALEAEGDVEFVFDVTVVEAGNSGTFVLKPVASESGTDQPIRLVDARVGAGVAANASSGVDVEANVSTGAQRSNASVELANGSVGVDLGTSGSGPNTTGGLELHVVGTPAPGETVTVKVTRGDAAVTDARVLLDGEAVGRTDADGTVGVTLPTSGTTTLRVEHGSASVDAELVFG